jgi:hypothetical protein
MAGLPASACGRPPPTASHNPLDQFGEIAGALDRAAAAIAKLGALLAGHPLIPAWLWRSRLEAVRRQAAADGRSIDPWHLAAIIEGVRFRMDRASAIIDRGAIFEAARHALTLWRWFVRPDEIQTAAIQRAAAALAASESASPLIAAALGVRAWLGQHGWSAQDGARPALRAALAQYWQDRGLMPIAAPLLSGTRAFCGDAPRSQEAWVLAFLGSLAEEAEAGLALLRFIEREWFAARAAVRDRRRDSHAAAAVDMMAAAPVVSATSLARGLGIAVKNAAALLDSFVSSGIAIEVTHRSKRRLFGLKHLAPLREEALPPRRARRTGGSTRRRDAAPWPAVALPDPEYSDAGGAVPPLRQRLALSRLEKEEFELTGFDDWMREADQVIRRSQAILDRLTQPAEPSAPQSDAA